MGYAGVQHISLDPGLEVGYGTAGALRNLTRTLYTGFRLNLRIGVGEQDKVSQMDSVCQDGNTRRVDQADGSGISNKEAICVCVCVVVVIVKKVGILPMSTTRAG